MRKSNIIDTVENGLCTACGICAGSCPKNCIKMEIKDGITTPVILEQDCIDCGICMEVCPGKSFDYKKRLSGCDDFWMGNFHNLLSAQIKDKQMLQQSTSGGVVTGLVKQLLEHDEYSCAFLVNTYVHNKVTTSERITKNDSFLNTPKSRYVTVSHEKAIRYILKNKEKKVILVGTGCFIHGVLNIIEKFHLDRNNYFLIGLFCDKTMTNNVYSYFEQHPASDKQLASINFRSKQAGNWPGGVRIFLEDGSYKDMSRIETNEYKGILSTRKLFILFR